MNEVVKMDLRVPRKNVLLLAKVIEKGLQVKKGERMEGLLQAASANVPEELQQIVIDLLQKAGLLEMNEKLNTLQMTDAAK